MRVILVILIVGTNCFVHESLLIKTQRKSLDQFDISMQRDEFRIVEDKEENLWMFIYRKLNFFRMNLWIDDYYTEYIYEVDKRKYKRIFACVTFYYWKDTENYLRLIFHKHRNEINNLTDITVIYREIVVYSWLTQATMSDCFILTGTLDDAEINKEKGIPLEKANDKHNE